MKRVLFFSDLIGSVQSSSVVNGQYLGSALQVRPEELENNEQVKLFYFLYSSDFEKHVKL
jgi:hypothetical protein